MLSEKQIHGTERTRFARSSPNNNFISGHKSEEQLSAELPAQFRNGEPSDGPPSRLARLCQQTSSVLASVLPAPFGGHKRSVLCQFLGAVPMPTNLTTTGQSRQHLAHNHRPSSAHSSYNQMPNGQQPELSESLTILQQPLLPPIALRSNGRHPIQMVLEHHLLANDNPHQHLLSINEASANAKHHHHVVNHVNVVKSNQQQEQIMISSRNQDLKESDSVLDFSYQQKIEAPSSVKPKHHDHRMENKSQNAKNINKKNKFSAPVSSTSFKPVSVHQVSPEQMSTSGWRIFDQSLVQQEQTTTNPIIKTPSENDTTQQSKQRALNAPFPLETQHRKRAEEGPRRTEKLASSSSKLQMRANASSNSTLTHHPSTTPTSTTTTTTSSTTTTPSPASSSSTTGLSLAAGSSTSSTTAQVSVTMAYRTNGTSPSTTITSNPSTLQGSVESMSNKTMKNSKTQPESDGMRTIEVTAQSESQQLANNQSKRNSNGTSTLVINNPSIINKDNVKLQIRVGQSGHFHPPREELVIASINNLTRIAFGNQLRDTVKVINQLIEQQAGLFQAPSRKAGSTDSHEHRQQQTRERRNKSPYQNNNTNNSHTQSASTSKSNFSPNINPATSSGASTTTKYRTSTTSSNNARIKLLMMSSSGSSSATPRSLAKQRPSQPLISATNLARSSLTTNPMRATSTSPFRPKWTSRSMQAALQSRSSPLWPAAGYEADESDLEPLQASTINDIKRDKWLVQANPIHHQSSSANNFYRKGSIQSKYSPDSSSWFAPHLSADMKSTAEINGLHNNIRKYVDPTPLDRWTTTTSSMANKRASQWLSGSSSSTKQTLVLSKLSDTLKQRVSGAKSAISSNNLLSRADSLTTLKLSLTTNQPLVDHTRNDQVSATTGGSLRDGGAAQSRWVPTALTGQQRIPTTTSMAPSIGSSKRYELGLSENEQALNELRASDSISKFTTTQWNEQSDSPSSRESLASLHRSTSSMPGGSQVASTGDFFLADTIADWPERYQSLMSTISATGGSLSTTSSLPTLSQSSSFTSKTLGASTGDELLESSSTTTQREPLSTRAAATASTKPMVELETTRRNGESAIDGSKLLYLGALSSTTRGSSATMPTIHTTSTNSQEPPILPANHKLSTSPVEAYPSITSIKPTSNPTTVFLSTSSPSSPSDQTSTSKLSFISSPTSATVLMAGLHHPSASVGYTLVGPITDMTRLHEETDPSNSPIPARSVEMETGYTNKQTTIGMSPEQTSPREKERESILNELSQSKFLSNMLNSNSTQKALHLNPNQTSKVESPSYPLRAPYSTGLLDAEEPMTELDEAHLTTAMAEDQDDESLSLYQPLNRPHVTRKLYDLLVPSARNFVGPANPINQQRFNLSALKYLIQNLLSMNGNQSGSPLGNSNKFNETSLLSTNSSDHLLHPIDPIDDDLNEELTQQQMIQLMGSGDQLSRQTNRHKFPNSLYELLHPSNKSTSTSTSTSSSSSSSRSSRSGNQVKVGGTSSNITNRAVDLINDLRRLEHKRAAAIMAAIRYQVPGPLVRPWDFASDLIFRNQQQQQQQTNPQSLIHLEGPALFRRHDYNNHSTNNHHFLSPSNYSSSLSSWRSFGSAGGLRGFTTSDGWFEPSPSRSFHLLPARRLAPKSSSLLFKQRFVASDELEARLSGRRRTTNTRPINGSDSSESSLRRLDENTDTLIELVDQNQAQSRQLQQRKQLNPIGDFDLIDLSQGNSSSNWHDNINKRIQSTSALVDGEPHFSDPLAKRSNIPIARGASPMWNNGESNNNKSAINNVDDTSDESSSNERRKSIETVIDTTTPSSLVLTSASSGFDCTNRKAGFYPDENSACQVSGIR